jgi:alkyl hydroperoxide reductase subunit AhpF
MTISAKDAKGIENWNGMLRADVTIRLLRTGDERTRQLENFCEGLDRLADKVHVIKEDRHQEGYPAMELSPGLLYQGVPSGAELRPFLEVLAILGEERPQEVEAIFPRVRAIEQPARLRLYVTPQCPSCPFMVRQLAPLPIIKPELELTVIEGELFPECAREDRVQAVPTVILDGGYRWTAVTPLDDILDVLESREPSQLNAKALKRMIKEGEAEKLAVIMAEAGATSTGLADLVVDPEWSTRLGAMVVMEELYERKPELAQDLLPALWERIEGSDVTVQGDVVTLIGQMGGPEWIEALQELWSGVETQELEEAVEEALERLKAKTH